MYVFQEGEREREGQAREGGSQAREGGKEGGETERERGSAEREREITASDHPANADESTDYSGFVGTFAANGRRGAICFGTASPLGTSSRWRWR